MNQHLQHILDAIQQDKHLSHEEKNAIIKSLKDADKEFAITSFKLDRTEKVKRTTAILLEETIEELEQKRKAVEAQNKELEIESSLERVRTVAMSMNNADDMLEVCKTISHQLSLLAVKEIRNVQTAIFYKEKGTYMNYEYYAKHDKTFITETSYTNSGMHTAFAAQMMKGVGESFATHMNGDEVKDWIAHQKTTNVFIDDYLNTASSLNYYWHSLGPVALGISTYEPLKEKEENLFRRFLKVFELAYRRYLDIEKALAQAREATIEAALEKVRSRSLAMHKSDEIKDVVRTVVEKITELKIEMNGGVSLVTFSPESKDLLHWLWIPEQLDDVFKAYLPYFNHTIFKDCDDAREQGLELIGKVYSGEDKQTYFNHLFHQTDFSTGPEEVKEWVMQQPYFGFSFAIQKHSGIFLNDYTGKFFSEETNNILVRFSKVFEQSFIRFLDLQKAEAQSRENQIQLALERARTQSMIMQHSTELDDTLRVFHEQVLVLNIPSAFSFLWLPDEDGDMHIFWAAWAENNSTIFKSKAINYPLDRNEPATAQCLIDWKSNEPVVSYHVPPVGVENYFAAWSELIAGVEQLKPEHFSGGLYYVEAFMKYGCFGVMVKSELQEDEKKILYRFAVEFEQTYTRFLDLQKAEAQARESQIQLALERVRARTMAMQKSDELGELSFELVKQVQSLGVATWHCAFNIYDEDQNSSTEWGSNAGGTYPTYKTPREGIFQRYYEIGQTGKPLHIEVIGEDKCAGHYAYLCTLPGVGEELIKLRDSGVSFPTSQIDHLAYFKYGYLLFITYEPVPEAHDIFQRFAKVFEQTYTRFLDLQNAEAQARESQIQLALERVRARTMAMQHSDELSETASEMFQQIQSLGLKTWSCGFNIINKEKRQIKQWVSTGDGRILPAFVTPSDEDVFQRFTRAAQEDKSFYVEEMGGEALKAHYQYMASLPEVKNLLEQFQSLEISPPDFQVFHLASFSYGYLMFITYQPAPEFYDVFKRFAVVFDQTYRRFLDLQNAEAQTRESQIQLALERVRARTMAMHQSNELADTASILFKQIKELGFETWSCGFCIWKENDLSEVWMAADSGGLLPPMMIPYKEEPTHAEIYKASLRREQAHHKIWEGKELEKHYAFLKTIPSVKAAIDILEKSGLTLPSRQCYYVGFFKEGYLLLITKEPNEGLKDLSKRFASVFDLTYTRFLDLQKAEAQSKEAQIEAALERVRSRSMGMQKSEELKEVIQIVYEQFVQLNINVEHTGFIINYKERDDMFIWLADKQTIPFQITIPYFDSPHWNSFIEAKTKGENFFANHLSFEEKNKFYEDMFKLFPVPDEAKEYYFNCPGLAISTVLLDNIGLYIENFSGTPYSEEDNKTLMRFGKVFEQTYTRFLDLQKAEAQAREAQIEAALERVRSRTLAMQKSDELAETAAVLFKQLILLGISPNRLYINIVRDETGEAEFWITDEDGSKVSMAYKDNLNKNTSFKKMFDGWKQQKKSLVIDMKGEELDNYFNYLSSIHVPFKGGLLQKRRLQYIAYFNKGFIGMASPDEQPEETIFLLERFAAVFNLTFTRFNDLKIAEVHAVQAEEDLIKLQTEKRRAEDALTDLKEAQKQLVQSEKMASLGELTAGIAHEIQNPLNFVNNFSEVSKELLDEMKAALESGHKEEAEEIANDIIQNLEKINHHGKRADAIVKGMLQHSRKSSGQKEPTDINALCDEYLRLSYHGLRAKDKEFNADFKTDFDESTGKVNIVPQDIGRVLLNLFNNAFYAVSEKKKLLANGYQPIVKVSTKKLNDKIEVRVSDNGNGIPQNIIDKIFQPFFTTKPTGQGTGLGLSLAYDIITKEHNGTLKVESEEGAGSAFTISLLLKN